MGGDGARKVKAVLQSSVSSAGVLRRICNSWPLMRKIIDNPQCACIKKENPPEAGFCEGTWWS